MNFIKTSLCFSILLMSSAINCMEAIPKKLLEICKKAEEKKGYISDSYTSYSCKKLQAMFECANARSPEAKEYCKRRINDHSDDGSSICYHVEKITRKLPIKEGAELLKKTKKRFEKISSNQSCHCDHF